MLAGKGGLWEVSAAPAARSVGNIAVACFNCYRRSMFTNGRTYIVDKHGTSGSELKSARKYVGLNTCKAEPETNLNQMPSDIF